MSSPQPPWGQNPSSGDSSSSSPRTGLWDLNGLDPKVPIMIQRGTGMSAGDRRHLGIGDQITAENSATAPVTALPGPVPDNAPEGTLGDLLSRPIKLYSTDPKSYLQLQQALFAGGFYGSTPASSIPWGSDPQGSTYDAWKRVLIAAQQAQSTGSQMTPEEILAQGVKQHQAATADGATKNPLDIQLTDPALITASAQQAAQAVLGHNMDNSEVQHFVSEFHAAQTAYSKQFYSAQNDQAGGTHTLVQPDLAGRLNQYLEQNHGTEIAGNALGDYVAKLESMVNGGG